MVPFSLHQHPVQFRVPPRSKLKAASPRAPRNILLLAAGFVLFAWWRDGDSPSPLRMLQPPAYVEHSGGRDGPGFSYAPVSVDRIVQFMGDSGWGDMGKRGREEKDSVSADAERLAEDAWEGGGSNRGGMNSAQGIEDAKVKVAESRSGNGDSNRAQNSAVEMEEVGRVADDMAPAPFINENNAQAEERTGPPPLRHWLKFTPNTAINFMHFHKTGGVSFKTSLLKYYLDKFKSNGDPVVTRDACYVREGVSQNPGQPTFALWRCDWEPIRKMNEKDRNRHDLVFGHQFWKGGAGELLNKRDLRTFTILRHPFDRKVSFYYHFFVREVGRKEGDVTYEEIRDFLLYDKLTIDADLGRDLGPNYMAGRLLSDGVQGYVGNNSFRYFHVDQSNQAKVVEQALQLVRNYVFVGLQKQNPASKCMLRKVIEVFNEVNGIPNIETEEIDTKAEELNRGTYSMSAPDIWGRFSREDRETFDRKERVDLTIYEEGERLFREHVKLFRCEHKLIKN